MTGFRSFFRSTLTAVAVAASAAAFLPGTAQAFTFTGGTGTGIFTDGTLSFTDFTCSGLSCSGVSYDAVPGPDMGVRYNPGVSLNLVGPGSTDVLLGFRVTGSTASITDFLLSSNAAFTGSGNVTDTLQICRTAICSPVSSIISQQIVETPPVNPGVNINDFVLAGGPFTSIWVYDDVSSIVPTGTVGTTQISRLDKVVTTSTPEPASLLLLGAGLLGLAAVRRTKHS